MPLVEHFLNHVVLLPKLKAHRVLVPLRSRITFHTQRHPLYYVCCVQLASRYVLPKSLCTDPATEVDSTRVGLGILPFQNHKVWRDRDCFRSGK